VSANEYSRALPYQQKRRGAVAIAKAEAIIGLYVLIGFPNQYQSGFDHENYPFIARH
jgi:hypothetical protein